MPKSTLRKKKILIQRAVINIINATTCPHQDQQWFVKVVTDGSTKDIVDLGPKILFQMARYFRRIVKKSYKKYNEDLKEDLRVAFGIICQNILHQHRLAYTPKDYPKCYTNFVYWLKWALTFRTKKKFFKGTLQKSSCLC